MSRTPFNQVMESLCLLSLATRQELAISTKIKDSSAIDRHKRDLDEIRGVIRFIKHIDYISDDYNASLAADHESMLPPEYMAPIHAAEKNNETTTRVQAIRYAFPYLFKNPSDYASDDDDS